MLSKAQEAALQAIRDCATDINRYGSCTKPDAADNHCRNVGEIIKDHFGIKEGESISDGPLKEVVVKFCDALIKAEHSRKAANLAKKYSI